MSAAPFLVILGVAVAGAAVAGLVGLGAAWCLRRRSLRWTLLVVAVVAAAGTCVGSVTIAYLMFLSPHDLVVTVVVSTVSGGAAVLVARFVGRQAQAWSTSLRDQLRAVEPGSLREMTTDGPRELRVLSAEWAEAQRRLEQARVREVRLEESRRELVSWVSHDLRTPLAGLRAMAEALEDGIADDPVRFHRQIHAEVDRLTAMVDDLFELSRIHAGVLQLVREPVAVHDLVSEAIAGAHPIARSRDVRLGGHVDEGLQVFADPGGLSRVIGNLVVNAIRHTPAGGTVQVHGRALDDGVELSVSDGCGGLDVIEMERVFDVGWQGDSARTPSGDASGQGAGLGLAIVKGIVEAHRGRVQVENLATATGCRFLVTLPA
ncbi:MAG TPA: HAMP domain-containing sensor histidine kinase [Marmoricola sp.]|jgi:signal transduction histidine kinase